MMHASLGIFVARSVTAVVGCACSAALLAGPVSWSGRVVDARTGDPVSGIECYGGASGRVDLTAKAVTDVTGAFTVVYEAPLDLGFWKYYAIDATDTAGRYFHYRRAQVAPEPLSIRLVPLRAFIQGTVRDAATGQALPGVEVKLARPGRIVQTVTTDAEGGYVFNPPAYDGANNHETIPAGEQVYDEAAVPVADYSVQVRLASYHMVNTALRGLTIPLRSSVTDAIHTRVDVALAPEDSPAEAAGATAELVTPPVWRVTSASVLNGTVEEALSYQIQANNAPTSFSAANLPPGLTLEAESGVISGTPTEAGLFTANLEAVGPEGTAPLSLTVLIRAATAVVFDNNNIWGVSSGPPSPTTFTLSEAAQISYVMDYHYFNGGVRPGTIALRHEDGTLYGPWPAAGRLGQGGVQNAYWEVWPMVVLKPGAYTVVDSHPATWSYNSQSGNQGISTIRGGAVVAEDSQLLETWARNHGLTGDDALATADPDGDQQPNWVELAVGGNPALPDPSPGLSFVTRPGQPVTLRLPVCAGGVGVPGSDFVVNGARVMIEFTPALSAPDWQPAVDLLDLVNALRQSQDDGREMIELPVKPASLPPGLWFIRERLMRVSQP